jgi:large subunit ribosomal protein L9
MQLLLKHNVENLGRIGDLVKVRDGYARNFLLPRGLAMIVNRGSLAEIERLRARARTEELERVKSLKEHATSLGETSVTIEGRANQEGHLFGSVNAAQIAQALRAKGFKVDERQVRLEHPLKEIGVFDVPIHLHAEVAATVKVWVVQAKPA